MNEGEANPLLDDTPCLTLEMLRKAQRDIQQYFHSQGIHLYCPSMWINLKGEIGCDEKL